MPTFVPSIFSSTINDSSAMKSFDSASLKMLVVVRSLGAEQMRRPGVFDEIVV